jgi:probable selenium-dependent hydroxylase accessory protein YqeC
LRSAIPGINMDPNQKVIYSIVEKHMKGTRKAGEGPLSLMESLNLEEREMISLVGAGGKTTLMFRLARELFLEGKKVVTTTTTKILEPASGETAFLYLHRDEDRLKEFILQRLNQYHHVTIARERLESGKLEGVSSNLANDLWRSCEIDTIIIEADGAAGRSIKAPREKEPVIPSNTTLVVALLGVDGVGMELNAENVFQPERVSKMTGIPLGEKITEKAMAILMTHPEGICKGTPSSSKVIAFLNKVDIPDGRVKGKGVAEKILERKHPGIERVVLGQLKKDPPVAEVIFPPPRRR